MDTSSQATNLLLSTFPRPQSRKTALAARRSGPRRFRAQFCDGKMPCSAMQKLRVRKGCLFSCGWLPPLAVTEAGARAELGPLVLYMLAPNGCGGVPPEPAD